MEEFDFGVSVKSMALAWSWPILTKRRGEESMTDLNIVITMTNINTVKTPM